VIAHLRRKGLVVVSGCAHAGIVNSVRYAQAITGVEAVHAIMGGFHLTGKLFEPIIPPTVVALKEINPRYVVPTHCTGWSAIHEIANALPTAFVANSVGTTLTF
jgi:7,8-dihydropterin-6-yl-methyl-4-(beta-D-ribofuranosyl)aminobenzene 5'-phosphate synthase